MEQQLLETGSVGRRLDLSSEYVRALADRGVLPIAVRTASGRRLFRAEDVEALRLQREREAIEA